MPSVCGIWHEYNKKVMLNYLYPLRHLESSLLPTLIFYFFLFSTFALQGTLPGQCQCREGYAGEKCDRCAFGYQGYPNCLRCNCSLVGSINEDPCTEPCLCKVSTKLSMVQRGICGLLTPF